MFGDGALTFQEFALEEALPLATIHAAVLGFLRGRADAALFGAQAVNAYVPEPRMTQGVDILSPRASQLAEELKQHLSERFHVAIRVRDIGEGRGFRVYQVRKPANRHLADVRPIQALPPSQRMNDVLVLVPVELIAMKLLAFHARRGTPKSFTDHRDLAVLLLAFPDLKTDSGAVQSRLQALGATPDVLATWSQIATESIRAGEDDDA